MNGVSLTHQQLVNAIEELPAESLFELATFIEYLSYKTIRKSSKTGGVQEKKGKGSPFLLAIAGLGNSGENDLSERDEEILAAEIDPIRGWGLKPDTQQ